MNNLEKALKEAKKVIAFYADKNNWRDVWKDKGLESPNFKYFYRLGHSGKDMENLGPPNYHYYMGMRARKWLKTYGSKE